MKINTENINDLLIKFLNNILLNTEEYELLEKNKILKKTSINHYEINKPKDTLIGVYKYISKEKGFIYSNGNKYFVSCNNLNCISNDIVLFKTIETNTEIQGSPFEIFSYNTRVIGTVIISNNYTFVNWEGSRQYKDIIIPQEFRKNSNNGDKVIVEITKRGDKRYFGKIINILGEKDCKGIDILSIIAESGIQYTFNKKVYSELKSIKNYLCEKDFINREDFRNKQIITIDGNDSKDFDDAISLEKLPNGNFELGVHIADVSHYVPIGSELDNAARERGNSIYLVDRVIPMLPEKLSNGICSLNPKEDRLALSCIMEVNTNGEVIDYKIKESIINSKERMTYDIVNDIVANNNVNLIKEYSHIKDLLFNMKDLATILIEKRDKEGNIDFESNECQIILDEQGIAIDIIPRTTNIATRIIEEFMILCNNTIAKYLYSNNLPCVYRNHEIPSIEKQSKLKDIITTFGYNINQITPKNLNDILIQCKNKPEEHYLNKMVLRCMEKAKYNEDNLGHFGLNLTQYCHFTSPIRRYSDLEVHRIIKSNLHKKNTYYIENQLSKICLHINKTEEISVKLEKKVEKLKKVEYISKYIGEKFLGIIGGITEKGLYIELPNTIEGFISINTLKDDFIFDEEKLILIGKEKSYRIGDEINIEVFNVNIEKLFIDFKLVDNI